MVFQWKCMVGKARNPECRCTLTTSRNNLILITLSTSRNNSTSVNFPSISATMTKSNASNLTFLHSLWRMHGGNGLTFVCWCILALSIQKYVVHSLLIFLLLEQLWLGSNGSNLGFPDILSVMHGRIGLIFGTLMRHDNLPADMLR